MNICDLNHLEVVSEAANIEGGYYYGYQQYANANANAYASGIAFGSNPSVSTYSSTDAFVDGNYVAGASSSSGSSASTSSGYYYY
ncbi:MAG: hypothetical protein VKK42_06525 [Lyngbya sp.]|nr:hypothetical protein [Lyngbya sp.]